MTQGQHSSPFFMIRFNRGLSRDLADRGSEHAGRGRDRKVETELQSNIRDQHNFATRNMC